MSTHNMLFSTLAGLLLFSACSTDYFNQTEGNMPAKDDILAIKRGMKQEDVRKIMGSPSAISSLDHKTWVYMNSTMKRMAFFEPEELERNIVAIEFNLDGQVERVVQLDKSNGREIVISSDETPVMGTEETFMEKYFGGVGYMPMQPTKENNGL
ncbi:MAG: outer membrane protein assembly factor BamE [Acetobacter sp.]|nr:outer membrane protein assembly factor BamE [Acetobacter sp.]